MLKKYGFYSSQAADIYGITEQVWHSIEDGRPVPVTFVCDDPYKDAESYMWADKVFVGMVTTEAATLASVAEINVIRDNLTEVANQLPALESQIRHLSKENDELDEENEMLSKENQELFKDGELMALHLCDIYDVDEVVLLFPENEDVDNCDCDCDCLNGW